MNAIGCNGFSTKLILDNETLLTLSGQDKEILQHALSAYGFVNCTCFGLKYYVSIQSWINEIEKIYDLHCPRNKAIIDLLNKLV